MTETVRINGAKLPLEEDGAEAVDAALSAAGCGVGAEALGAAFGDEAARLAATARLLTIGARPAVAAPDDFVLRLEKRVGDTFDARPVPGRRVSWLPSSRRLAAIGAGAVALALATFMLTGTPGVGPSGTPTAVAATSTATEATPEARVTSLPSAATDRSPMQAALAEPEDVDPEPIGSPARSSSGHTRTRRDLSLQRGPAAAPTVGASRTRARTPESRRERPHVNAPPPREPWWGALPLAVGVVEPGSMPPILNTSAISRGSPRVVGSYECARRPT